MMFHFFDVTVGVVGLMHLVCWSPALYLLVKRRPSVDPKTLFGVWVHSMIAVLSLSLAFDHRLNDGAPAARFLQRIKQLLIFS